MNFRLFQYALPAPPLLEDLNAYLAAHRVASVAQHLVPAAGGTSLVFIVQTVGEAPARAPGTGAAKTDYREQLSTEDFELFNRLRDERKKWAEAEAVPVYTIFSNAQLAAMVQKRVRSTTDLEAIEGIGPARVAKYGERLLAVLVTPEARATHGAAAGNESAEARA